jgi:adenine-specific DNA-methyltransferase
MVDTLIQKKRRTHTALCSYYTESSAIVDFMIDLLKIGPGDKVLEPCAGDGAFVDAILQTSNADSITIDALEIGTDALSVLNRKFGHQDQIRIRQVDTLLDLSLDSLAAQGGYYTRIIGNPPYGAWQDFERRDLLKQIYGGYVRETYALFLRRCISLLKPGGRLVFIIPDTFLSLHLHKSLRRYLLQNCRIERIVTFPSKLFPGIGFGYSKLCIISLVRGSIEHSHEISYRNIEKEEEFLVASESSESLILQTSILPMDSYSFTIHTDKQTHSLFKGTNITLGDIARCVTGFYSGDNTRFLRVLNKEVRGSRDYHEVNLSNVETNIDGEVDALGGLRGSRTYLPFLKSSRVPFFTRTEWFVDWSTEAVNHYKTDAKSRFQNSSFYFKEGIAIPMLKSGRVRAFAIERRIFDQSLVGIFPVKEEWYDFLLCFFNSETCDGLIRALNPSVNNSANYLKRLPIRFAEESLIEAHEIVEAAKKTGEFIVALESVDLLFSRLYKD